MERKQIAGWTPDQGSRVWDATQAYERSLGSSAPRLESLPGVSPILFRNDSGEEIPPYGIMHITGTVQDKFNYITTTKPSSSNLIRSKLLVNGPNPIADSKFGTAQSGPIFRIIHDGAISYQSGDRVGYKSGSFLAGLNPTFLVLGEDDLEDDMLRVMFDDSVIYGVAAGTITSTVAGNVSVGTPYAPTARTHVAKTIGSSVSTSTNVKLTPAAGEWIALGIC